MVLRVIYIYINKTSTREFHKGNCFETLKQDDGLGIGLGNHPLESVVKEVLQVGDLS